MMGFTFTAATLWQAIQFCRAIGLEIRADWYYVAVACSRDGVVEMPAEQIAHWINRGEPTWWIYRMLRNDEAIGPDTVIPWRIPTL